MTIDGTPGHQAPQALLDEALGVHVDVGRGLVEDEDPRVGHQRPREGDELALAGGELDSALADLGVIALRQRHDEVVGADGAGGVAQLLLGGVQAAEGQVLAHGAAEQEALLGHHPHLGAQRVRR